MALPLAAGAIGGLLKSGLGKTILSGAKNTISTNPLGMALGAGQMITGAIQKKKAQSMLPSPEDVGERALLNTLRRRQQAITTGTAYNPQMAAGKQMAKSLSKNAFAAGGPVNQGMYSNLMSQTMGNIAQQTGQELAQNLGQQGQLVKDMANRKADLTLLQRNEGMADAATNRKAGFQNLAAAIMPPDQEYQTADGTPKKKKKNADVDLTEQELDEDGNPIND
jgi:hypothetical protein